MRRFYLSYILLFGILMISTLSSQTESPFTSFDVFIYPEYDHPGVGIFVEGSVKPGQYPRFLELEVPLETTIALLRGEADGEPTSERIEIQQREGKAFLPLDLTEPNFKVQYYFNPFTEAGAGRSFTFAVTTNETLPEWHIILQKPVMAENFQHSLDDAEELDGEFNMKFYRQHVNGLGPNTAYTVQISYQNPDSSLTMTGLQAIMEQQAAAGGPDPRAPVNPRSQLPMVTGIMVLLGIAIYGYLKLKAQRMGMDTQIVGQGEADQTGETKRKSGSAKSFCAGCGSPLKAGAKFCSNCGRAV